MNGFLLKALVIVGALTWAVLLASQGWVLPTSFFTPLSVVTSVVAAAFALFDRWLWRWSAVQRIIGRPDLTGTWRGEIRSNWVNPTTGAKPGPIPAFFAIHQTFSTLHVRMITRESQSVTLAATLLGHSDGVHELVAVYRNTPGLSVRERSEIHNGGLVLTVGGPPPTTMAGQYWTDRHTDGEISAALINRGRVSDFESASRLTKRP